MPLERRFRRLRGNNTNNSSSSSNSNNSNSTGVSALRVLNFLCVVPWAGLKRDPAPRDTSKTGGRGAYYANEARREERSVANSIRDTLVGVVEDRGNLNNDDNTGDDVSVRPTVDGDFDSSCSTTTTPTTAATGPGTDDMSGGQTIGTINSTATRNIAATSTPRGDSGNMGEGHNLLHTPSPRARLRTVSFNEVVKVSASPALYCTFTYCTPGILTGY